MQTADYLRLPSVATSFFQILEAELPTPLMTERQKIADRSAFLLWLQYHLSSADNNTGNQVILTYHQRERG